MDPALIHDGMAGRLLINKRFGLSLTAETVGTNKNAQSDDGAFWLEEPDDDLLSHGNPHYHWRKGVSLSCSGWEGVGPPCYGHQA